MNESIHLKYLDKYITLKKLDIKIVYRPHPWKQKHENEKHLLNLKLKNVILDPFSKKIQ